MRIRNTTRRTVIAERVEVARSFWKKTLGLMFRGSIGDSDGFLLEFGREGPYGIWMFGMRFPIDLVFIDSRKRVVDVFESIMPVGMNPATWRVYSPSRPVKWVLELKAGRANETRTKKGDRISFSER
jgi:uncharacterized membrane protein (UPF0127 family)